MSPSPEVADAVGEVESAESLEDRAAALRQIVETPNEREVAVRELLTVEQQLADRRRAELMEAASKRLLGIVRAMGSLTDVGKHDETKLHSAARQYAEAAQTVNERFDKLNLFRHEAAALVEVFDLIMPTLPTVTIPASRTTVQEAVSAVSQVRVRDTGRIDPAMDWEMTAQGLVPVRRNYGELSATDGGALIQRKLGK